MIDALVAGRLHGPAKQGQGKNGDIYTTAKVKVVAGSGDTLLCGVIAFDRKAQATLLALEDGDSVAMTGSLTPKVYTDKTGDTRPAIDLVCHAVMTPYQMKHKRHEDFDEDEGEGLGD